MDLSNCEDIYIVCDTSGSMAESAKGLIVRGVVRNIEQYARYGLCKFNIKLIYWNSTASLIEWNPDDEFPSIFFKYGGSSNAQKLLEILTNIKGKILLLTDGFWPKEDAKIIKQWKRTLPSKSIKIIKIGADVNLLSADEDTFTVDELLVVLYEFGLFA